MELLIIVTKVLIGFILGSFISFMIANLWKWKYYKSYYKTLDKDNYRVENNILYIKRKQAKNVYYWSHDKIISLEGNDIKGYIRLPLKSFAIFDLYTYYWWVKYKNWFKLNFPNIK